MAADKWSAYYASGSGLPWDTQRPASQLVAYLTTCMPPDHALASSSSSSSSSSDEQQLEELVAAASAAELLLPPEQPAASAAAAAPLPALHVCARCAAARPPPGGRVLEVGCGTGGSALWLALRGFHVTGIDIVPAAVEAATAAAVAASEAAAGAGAAYVPPRFVVHDIWQLRSLAVGQRHHVVYDCQVYHALWRQGPPQPTQQQQAQQAQRQQQQQQQQLLEEQAQPQPQPQPQHALAALLFDALLPGGLLFLLAGNANEPEIGPAVLTARELLAPLLAAGFEPLLLRQTRFDETPHYRDVLHKRPLAWWLVARRPA